MRKQLVYLAIKYNGDYYKITKAVVENEKIPHDVIEKELKKIKSNYVTILDEHYPILLRQLKNPPYVLFYYGNLSYVKKDCVALIGMRECSVYGSDMAKYFTKQLSDYCVVVSGLAKGIDRICHLNAKKTIAVLGCGIDYCYPKENLEIYNNIKINGLLISEYPGDLAPKAYYFPWRNRIVAALSLGIVVIEARRKSGTMITVSHALELGKPIFAVPCRINDYNGTLGLIKDGAICVESPLDIIEELNLHKGY